MSYTHTGVSKMSSGTISFYLCIWIVLLFNLSCSQHLLQSCVHYVVQSDSNNDKSLDAHEFLNLIESFTNGCEIRFGTLSEKQLTVFMKLSQCTGTCNDKQMPPTYCCTPEMYSIDVRPSSKALDSLTFAEKVTMNLLCVNAFLLSNELSCNEKHLDTVAAPSSTARLTSALQVINPTNYPTIPLVMLSSNPSSSHIPTDVPSTIPSISLSTGQPTSSPTQQVIGTDITAEPSAVSSTPLPIPSTPIDPTSLPNSPIFDQPTGGTEISNSPTTQTEGNEVTNSPTYLESDNCIAAMIVADSEKDQSFTFNEYVVFARKIASCTGILETDSSVIFGFTSINCLDFGLSNILACVSATIDISAAYIRASDRTAAQEAELRSICDITSYAVGEVTNCVNVPTPSPEQQPVSSPVNIPTFQPTVGSAVTLNPTKAPDPLSLPTGGSDVEPSAVPSTTVVDAPQTVTVTFTPTVGSESVCISNLIDSDSDFDLLLTQEEFVTFVSKQGDCELITSLSEPLANVFTILSVKCLDVPDANINCALPRNARVSIDGKQNQESVCSETLKVLSEVGCTESPMSISIPVSSPIAPVNSPIAASPDIVATSQIPVQPPNNATQPIAVIPEVPEDTAPTIIPTVEAKIPSNPTLFPINEPRPTSVSNPPFTAEESPSILPNFIPSLVKECEIALLSSDGNNDGHLNQAEYLNFIQLYSKCDLITVLSNEQIAVFQALACTCLTDPTAAPDCCLPGNAKVKASTGLNTVADICAQTASTFEEECVSSPTMTPYTDLFQCSKDLVESDQDKNGFIDKNEYLKFIQIYGKCDEFDSLDFGHYSVFQTITCECLNFGETIECCLPGNATLNISGASSNSLDLTDDQISTLSKICKTANGLTKRECIAPTVDVPVVDCANDLVSSDENKDGFINHTEFLFFYEAEISSLLWN